MLRLGCAMIFAKDFAGMTDFYSRVLGVAPVAATRTDAWVEFETAGGGKVALHAIPPPIAAEIEIASPPAPREETPIKLIFSVDDLVAEKARLQALGVILIERPWGGCDGMDPEGNVFGLSHG